MPTIAPAPDYIVVEDSRADQLFVQPPGTYRWRTMINDLLSGKSVFAPGMTRLEVESLRSIIAYHKYGVLRTRTTVHDGQDGRILRLVPKR